MPSPISRPQIASAGSSHLFLSPSLQPTFLREGGEVKKREEKTFEGRRQPLTVHGLLEAELGRCVSPYHSPAWNQSAKAKGALPKMERRLKDAGARDQFRISPNNTKF
ncbi:hypothetical protein A4R35_03355 [Thermogemmatispora tikiterensis]|uniref:Uncharacterized protein n=1 Tax=Thermogemmatispora tikiterensis TaxID=1825093 RepID=A0A328VA64_9CHLR|nr:hypothetical protein A4R35_03355 [Thermogemmatispora tikiterensis]